MSRKVIDAQLVAHGSTQEAVGSVQERPRGERGGCAERSCLFWTE